MQIKDIYLIFQCCSTHYVRVYIDFNRKIFKVNRAPLNYNKVFQYVRFKICVFSVWLLTSMWMWLMECSWHCCVRWWSTFSDRGCLPSAISFISVLTSTFFVCTCLKLRGLQIRLYESRHKTLIFVKLLKHIAEFNTFASLVTQSK
jgi:hypothetical protein